MEITEVRIKLMDDPHDRLQAFCSITLDGSFVKLVSWYDNEYGYTCNMLRFVRHVAAN